MKVNRAVLVLYCAILSRVKPQDPSPCPDVLKYEDWNARSGSWFAILTLGTFEDLDGVWVLIELDRDAEELASQFGETTALSPRKYLIAYEDFQLKSQNPFPVKISAKYDALNAIPSVVVIRLNGRLVCGNPPTTTPATTTTTTTTRFITYEQKNSCGPISNIGRWPWSVSILKIGDDETLKFHCGGVLISDWHVLTTGRCVTKSRTRKLEAEDLLLYLGTDRLRKHGPGLQIAQVAEIYTHPNYKGTSASDDLAVLKLARAVERNGYVTPVCFPGKENIVGKSATLVTWSRNDNRSVSQQERKMPVVPQETCVNFDRNFYSRLVSPKTFCAGYADGTLRCEGSPGSGLVSQSPDGLQWRLHGIAASARTPQDRNECEPEGYVIFMNVTHYVDWLTAIVF